MSSPLFRSLLTASLCLAPVGWAAAQDQQNDDQQHQRDHQEQHQQQHNQPQQQHGPQQQQHSQPPQQGNSAPQGQHAGGGSGGQGGGEHQFQRPAQTNTAPPSPPAGATASPTPPSTQGQFQHGQRQPQNNGAAPAATTPPPQQQQFQQRSVQRGGGAPVGSAAPQAQSQPQQQHTATTRANFQGNTHGANTAAFTQHHGGAAPTQFDHGHFYGHDYAHFTPHDRDLWYRGAWHHEFRDGRYGWWYAVDDVWYFYAAPVYPYPTYIPDVVYIPEEEEAPPPVYVDAPPEPAPPPQYGQPPAYYYYFCPDTQSYYPYVGSCASAWQPVPTSPPPQ